MVLRPQIMGILNVTPDSFSDGGDHDAIDKAVAHAQQMLNEGADIIDIGGESTRPGAQRIDAAEQIMRTAEIVKQVRELSGHPKVSIDTTSAQVAQAAIDRGATMINDVSAGEEDARMFQLAASCDVDIVLMHMRGEPGTMQNNPTYDDVVGEVEKYLLQRAAAAQSEGVKREHIWIDPGIGFGKTSAHALALLSNLKRFVDTGYPVLLGTSRKRFATAICKDANGQVPGPKDRVGATCATTALGAAAGVGMFRVHDVRANRQAADVAISIKLVDSSGNF